MSDISTNQVRSTGDIVGIAIVERLDRIIALLEPMAFPVREIVIDEIRNEVRNHETNAPHLYPDGSAS